MLEDALLDLSNCGDIVIDPFLGSGSTLLAAYLRTDAAGFASELPHDARGGASDGDALRARAVARSAVGREEPLRWSWKQRRQHLRVRVASSIRTAAPECVQASPLKAPSRRPNHSTLGYLINANGAPSPRMPRVDDLELVSSFRTVCILVRSCTIPHAAIRAWAIFRPSNTKGMMASVTLPKPNPSIKRRNFHPMVTRSPSALAFWGGYSCRPRARSRAIPAMPQIQRLATRSERNRTLCRSLELFLKASLNARTAASFAASDPSRSGRKGHNSML